MKTVTLVSQTQIVIKIFNLVCSKLNLELIVLDNELNIKPSDILIFEDKYFDTNNTMRYKSLSSNISIIAKEKIYEYESFNVITKPFLPSQLKDNLSYILNNIKRVEEEIQIDGYNDVKYNEDVSDLVDFIDSIEEEKLINNEDEEDIFINKDELGHGGVLDKAELDILHEMINDEDDDSKINELLVQNNEIDSTQQNSDWLELSDIIDKAIDDVQAIEVDDELFLLLEEHTMLELSPLLNKLNQNCIDRLSNGEELVLKMKLKKSNE